MQNQDILHSKENKTIKRQTTSMRNNLQVIHLANGLIQKYESNVLE